MTYDMWVVFPAKKKGCSVRDTLNDNKQKRKKRKRKKNAVRMLRCIVLSYTANINARKRLEQVVDAGRNSKSGEKISFVEGVVCRELFNSKSKLKLNVEKSKVIRPNQGSWDPAMPHYQ
jgi:acetyl-CoA carboxylase beta subunit